MMMSKHLQILVLTLASLFILSLNISKPFIGHHDFNSNLWSLTAKNNLSLGISCTKLGQVTNFYNTACNQLTYYMNHPPLISWLTTFSFAILGISEATARVPVLFISSGSMLLIYLIGSRLFSPVIGFCAASISLATPMFIYFGKSINHEPLVLFGILLAIYSYIHMTGTDPANKPSASVSRQGYYLFLVSAIWVGLAGWHGYVIFVLIWLNSIFVARNTLVRSSVPIFMLIFIFVLHRAHTCLIGDCSFSIASKLMERTGLNGSSGLMFTPIDFIRQLVAWTKAYYSLPLVLLGTGSLLINLKLLVKKRYLATPYQPVLLLLLFGASIPLIFSQQAMIHDYLLIYLLPFFSLGATLTLHTLAKLLSNKLSLPAWIPKSRRHSLVFLFLSTTTVVAVIYSTHPFLTALQKSESGLIYLKHSEVINSLAHEYPESRILIEAQNYYELSYQHLTNYSYGRYHASRSDTLASFVDNQALLETNFTHIMTISTNPVALDLIEFLDQRYAYINQGEFRIYQLPSLHL